MSDRIRKFRIWDDYTNKFSYFDVFNVQGNCPLDIRDNLEDYIGMSDHSKQEIYEGDILKARNGGIYEVFWNDICSQFAVAVLNEEELEGDYLLSITFLTIIKNRLKIIGNIHTGKYKR